MRLLMKEQSWKTIIIIIIGTLCYIIHFPTVENNTLHSCALMPKIVVPLFSTQNYIGTVFRILVADWADRCADACELNIIKVVDWTYYNLVAAARPVTRAYSQRNIFMRNERQLPDSLPTVGSSCCSEMSHISVESEINLPCSHGHLPQYVGITSNFVSIIKI